MAVLVKEFRANQWMQLFDTAALADFDSLWNKTLTPVEEGNFRGGGWSNVCTIDISGTQFYIKRQSNYFTRAPLSFFRKTPVVNVEFEKINLFRSLGILTLDVAYFGWQKKGAESQAILITRSLEGFRPLNEVLLDIFSFRERRQLFSSVGKAISGMHQAGQRHVNLSPKHIFVKHMGNGGFEIRFIDLESSRPHFGLRALKLRDLEKLNRTLRNVHRSEKLKLLLSYAKKSRVDGALRKDIAVIDKRTAFRISQ